MAPPSRKQEVIDALPGTCLKVMKDAKMCQSTAGKWLALMHKNGEIHIISWHWGGGNKMPKYAYGPGKDAKCQLKASTPAAYSRAYRKRKKKAEADFVAAKQRACEHADAIVRSKQSATWLSALM